uniref:Uncharacterized protein n=1 Tax=Brassica oleracea var. oleracea TaxID=109376 RepID=A0A0D2ZUJ8_BRAOL
MAEIDSTSDKSPIAFYFVDISPGPSDSGLRFSLIHFWEAKNTASGHCDARIFKMFLTEIYLFCYTLEIVDQNEPKLYLQWHTLFKAMPWGVNKNWYGGLFCGAGSGCGGSGVIDVDMIFVKLMTFRLIILQEVDGYICRYNKNSHAILHLSRDRGCRQVVAFHNNLNSKYLLESQNHHQPI